MITQRLSFYAKHYGLLPNTQFRGRPGRITEQALLVLANAIDKAWYKQKVVTLVAFDLKGAFNGVNQISLDARLQSKGIPLVARRWITSFISGRQASIRFDDYQTTVAPLDNARLAQGSPLSPILFAFFNCDLVNQPVDSQGKASAFIDDYFRWRWARAPKRIWPKSSLKIYPVSKAGPGGLGPASQQRRPSLFTSLARERNSAKGNSSCMGIPSNPL